MRRCTDAAFPNITAFGSLMISQGARKRCRQVISGVRTGWSARAHSLLRNSPICSRAGEGHDPAFEQSPTHGKTLLYVHIQSRYTYTCTSKYLADFCNLNMCKR